MMELLKPNNICSETLKHFGMGMMFCYLDMLIFYWKYMNIVKNDVYKPNTVFQKKKSIFFC
jgi:Na+-transporting methylmalonyl-CoA/oxaloacetate decarboxylase gamma subunit